MELKEGMYVRTKYEGIFIISHINTNFADDDYSKVCLCQNEKVAFTSVDTISQLNFSNNIIDLIEVGDYVNDYRVDFIENIDCPILKIQKVFCEEYEKDLYSKSFNIKDIKSIVTKEQFS